MTKKVLITGVNSYVGNQLAEWLNKEPEKYEVVKKSVRNNKWKEIVFSSFDVVVHVAGIAHQDTKADQEDQYYKINTNLTIELATKAKAEGVSQFIFMSSMIVYGASSKIGETKVITKETIPEPVNFYGNSKLLAEEGILPLQTEEFNVVVIRPPMIYGKGSKGNYPLLAKFAKVSPVFPDIENQRSMLYVDNLTEIIRLIIVNEDQGIFFPQNKSYVQTSEMVETIAKVNEKKIKLIKLLNPLLLTLGKKIKIINKVFGSLTYEPSLSFYESNYQLNDLKESIKATEITEMERMV
ncbi:NAD-dependent epimerase/dehydratase family protein [Carnobacterium sp. CS13]|uniref:NAD-dependent epimerase/dehydratase family protein n=1 Tax=Carnobacterium sp. CS13 TaxID=2800128 RepID=UPI001912DD7B|nr:NAD-dependent epimerase/dehydratase family protein [Carnobacterium sp. CS13]QQP69557.1 NAD-dependent epimerase/dehydratase family protein [Carnobacterium sp. CS13]